MGSQKSRKKVPRSSQALPSQRDAGRQDVVGRDARPPKNGAAAKRRPGTLRKDSESKRGPATRPPAALTKGDRETLAEAERFLKRHKPMFERLVKL
jgi:hypothetical protein